MATTRARYDPDDPYLSLLGVVRCLADQGQDHLAVCVKMAMSGWWWKNNPELLARLLGNVEPWLATPAKTERRRLC